MTKGRTILSLSGGGGGGGGGGGLGEKAQLSNPAQKKRLKKKRAK